MAVANTFIFGGVSTTTYGVIVEGQGDYSGAKRAVEMISIPGTLAKMIPHSSPA